MAALWIAVLAWGCAPSPPERPNVVLIVVDTLRWDRLGAYGAERPTSPAIDALAAESIRFERAYATSSWTRPSIGSMLTGLAPTTHGGWAANRALPQEAVTLAEVLAGDGYATLGVVSNFVISRANGFAQGFDHFDESAVGGFDAISTEAVTDRAIRSVEAAGKGDGASRPFFLFVHYFDPHYNYREDDDVAFAAQSAGRLDGSQSMTRLSRLERDLTTEEIGFLRDLYDEEIRRTDRGVGRLLAWLEDSRRSENTIVVFTSDHGEEFLDHARLGHTHSLYEELIRVPLLLRIPGEPGRVAREAVSLLGLMPTLLERTGSGTKLSLPGRSLLEGPGTRERFAFAEVDFESRLRRHKTAALKAIVGRRHKLILDEATGDLQLYDLETDPLERENLADREPALLARLRSALTEQTRESRRDALRAPARELTAAEVDMLRGLGYVEE